METGESMCKYPECCQLEMLALAQTPRRSMEAQVFFWLPCIQGAPVCVWPRLHHSGSFPAQVLLQKTSSSLLFPSPFPSGFSIHCSQMLFSMSLGWDSPFLVSIFSKALSRSIARMREKWPLLGAMTPEMSLLQCFWCEYCSFVGLSFGTFVTNAHNIPLHVEENSRLCCKTFGFLLLNLTTKLHDFLHLSLCAVAFSHLSA